MVTYTRAQLDDIFQHLIYNRLQEPNDGTSVIMNALVAHGITNFSKLAAATKAQIDTLCAFSKTTTYTIYLISITKAQQLLLPTFAVAIESITLSALQKSYTPLKPVEAYPLT